MFSPNLNDANPNDFPVLDTSQGRYKTVILGGAPKLSDIKDDELYPLDHVYEPFRINLNREPTPWRVVKTGELPAEAAAEAPAPRLPALSQDSVDCSLELYLDSTEDDEEEQEHDQESTDGDTSFFSTSFASTSANEESVVHDLPELVTMTDLEDLPAAKIVGSSPKHTHTITSLVGVIAVSYPKTISTRFNTHIDLVSLIVGDETAAGFRIDVWMYQQPKTQAAKAMRETIEELRIGDVILVKNISLGVYAEKVFGTTMPKAVSKISIIRRLQMFDEKEQREYGGKLGDGLQDRKIRKVEDWVKEFVDTGRPVPRTSLGEGGEELPDDTPANRSFAVVVPG